MPVTALSSTGAGWVLGGNFYKVSGDESKKLFFNLLFFDFIFKFFWIAILWLLTPVVLPLVVKEYEIGFDALFKLSLLSILLSSFTASISFILVLKKKAATHAFVEIIGPVSAAAITLACLALLKLTTISLFLGSLGAEVLSVLAGLWFIRKDLTLHLSKKWFLEIIRVGLPSIPLDLIGILTNISDRYFVQRWLNLSSLGIYAHSINYKSIFGLGFKAFNRMYAPKALENFSLGSEPNNLRNGITKWLGLAAIGGVFVALFSKEIVNILSHGKFIEAAPLVPLWYLIIFSYGFGTTYTQFLFAHKKSVYLTISGIISGLFSIILIAIGVYYFGIIGAVIGALLSNFITQCTFKVYAAKLGCVSVADKGILKAAFFIFSIYLLNIYWQFDLATKSILFIILSIVVSYHYRLLSDLKAIKMKL